MVNRKLREAAARGVAVDSTTCCRALSGIAADGRAGWKNGFASLDAVRSYRERNREVA